MESPCQVRPATRADVPAIVTVERTVFSDPWSAAAFLEMLGPLSRVAVVEGEVVGYLFGRVLADEGEVLNLAVREDQRGRGVGRKLIDDALDLFRAQRVRTIYLEVRNSNTQGRAFYENVGFRQVGRRRSYYEKPREDALVLALEIEPSKRPA